MTLIIPLIHPLKLSVAYAEVSEFLEFIDKCGEQFELFCEHMKEVQLMIIQSKQISEQMINF